MGKHPDEGRARRSRTYTFSFSLTRTDPEDLEDTKAWSLRSLSRVDLMILGALAVVFALEPFAIYMLLTHYRGPLLADRCGDGARVIVTAAESPGAVGFGAEPIRPDQEVITPLYSRDPASLVMSPGLYDAPVSRPEPEPSGSAWKEATASGAARSKKGSSR